MKLSIRQPRLLAMAAGALVIVSVSAGAMSLALFTDSQAVGANTFSTGTVDISTSPTTALVTFSAMAPGDQVTAPITVTNAGTLDLRYAISSVATNADSKGLKDQLALVVKSGVTSRSARISSVDGRQGYPADPDLRTMTLGCAGLVLAAMRPRLVRAALGGAAVA